MLNLFINRECNLHCDYCFVAKDFGGAPAELTRENFELLLGWLRRTSTATVAILGGEPTLHPDLFYFLESLWSSGVCPVLFTNALFPSDWAASLASLAYNIVINYNGPEMYRVSDYALREKNVELLIEKGAKISFSKNFAPGHLAYDYLLAGARRWGVQTIRYDFSRPREDRQNQHFAPRGQGEGLAALVEFVQAAATAGLAVGLDCCLPQCWWAEPELSWLRAWSRPFSGVCRPSLDILPDLSVIHCWPLKNIRAPEALAFDGELDLLGYFAEAARPLRQKSRSRWSCPDCPTPPSVCQGGCLAGALELG
ncbi:MAG: radical SAM protein [Deltaproteobacteria bacterium]|jgi:MoaA/NifB/PqqE/SkfB family radical SAM enzyme|nr:radical SAM protein [Deltaproteobacteria bacterium]